MSPFNSSSTSTPSTSSSSASRPSRAPFTSDQYRSQDLHLPYSASTRCSCVYTLSNLVFCPCNVHYLHGRLASGRRDPLRSNLVLLAPLARQASRYDRHLLLAGRTQSRRNGQF